MAYYLPGVIGPYFNEISAYLVQPATGAAENKAFLSATFDPLYMMGLFSSISSIERN
jgi:hypothetical protein